MGSRSQASANPTLTNYAQGLAQDVASKLSEFLAPSVDTGGSSIGAFKKYSEKNQFQVFDTARALGGGFKRIPFLTTDGTYNCLPQGLEITVDDAEREAAGAQDPIRLDESKVKTLVTSAAIGHEDKVLGILNAALSAVSGKGVWSDTDVDPVKELDEQIESIVIETGRMPNRMALGIGAWRVLKNHPKVLARQPGSVNQGVTMQQFASMLLNPGVDIRVGILSKDTTKFGAAKSAVNIVGARLYLFYAESNPTVYDPSFAKTFTTRMGGVDTVETYRDETSVSDIHRVKWSEDIQVCTSPSARRIDLS